jgi:hypothetical protein
MPNNEYGGIQVRGKIPDDPFDGIKPTGRGPYYNNVPFIHCLEFVIIYLINNHAGEGQVLQGSLYYAL